MKNLIIALLLFVSATSARADIIDDIAGAIRSGNAKEISKYFSGNVELKVLDQENIYSKAQAELIIRDFFTKHPVKNFTLAHKSTAKPDSQFAIGTLETSNGKYRVHYFLKKTGDKLMIQQFRIETEDD